MRPMEKPAASHDSDLLLAVDATSFREWLVRQGVRVRSAKGADKTKGILFWVRPTGTPAWLSVDAPGTAAGKYASTHRNLRAYLNEFLLKPLNSSMRKAKREQPAVANTNGLVPVSAAAKKPAQVKHLPGAVVAPSGVQVVHELCAGLSAEKAVEVRKVAANAPTGHLEAVGLSPAKQCAGSCGAPCSSPATAPAIVLDERLEDLRDDFALHAPLAMETGESLQAFAARRWEYARVMMEARPANVRG